MADHPTPEWGKLNGTPRFHVVSVDLDRAFALMGMTRYEQALFQWVREHTWGESARKKIPRGLWPDAHPCRPNLEALAKLLGFRRQRLSAAKSSLVRDRILIDNGGHLSINKSVHECPRMTPEALAYAAAGRAEKRTEKCSVDRTEKRSVPGDRTEKCSPPNGKVFAPERKSVRSPIEERAAEDPTGLDREEDTPPQPPPRGGAGEDSSSTPRPTRSRRGKKPLEEQIAGFAARLAEALAAGKEPGCD